MGDVASVEQRLAALEAQIAAVAEERDEYRKLVMHLREENERLSADAMDRFCITARICRPSEVRVSSQ